MLIGKIVSGGQTGVDRGALEAALILAIGTELTGGTKRTVEFCKKHGKPYWVEDLNAPKETDRGLEVLYWIEALGESIVLNVAGPRESKTSGIQQATREYVKKLIGVCENTHGDVGEKGLAICSEQMHAGGVGARCQTLRANPCGSDRGCCESRIGCFIKHRK